MTKNEYIRFVLPRKLLYMIFIIIVVVFLFGITSKNFAQNRMPYLIMLCIDIFIIAIIGSILLHNIDIIKAIKEKKTRIHLIYHLIIMPCVPILITCVIIFCFVDKSSPLIIRINTVSITSLFIIICSLVISFKKGVLSMIDLPLNDKSKDLDEQMKNNNTK